MCAAFRVNSCTLISFAPFVRPATQRIRQLRKPWETAPGRPGVRVMSRFCLGAQRVRQRGFANGPRDVRLLRGPISKGAPEPVRRNGVVLQPTK